MKNTDDEPRRLSFKDFTVVDYVPGEGQYINYQAQKRHRGTVGEEVEQVDEKVVPYNKELLARMIDLVQDYLVDISSHGDITEKDYKSAMAVIKKIAGDKVAAEVSSDKAISKLLYGRHRVSGTDIMRDRQGLSGRKKNKSGKLSKVSMSNFKKDVEDAMSRHQKVTRKLPESVEHLDEKVRPLEMTQAKYDSYPKNKKGKSGGKLYIIQNQKSGVTKGGVKFTSLGGGAGTTKVPVKIVKELPYKYEESVEQVDEGGILDKLRFKNKKTPNRGPSDYIKAGETHDIGGTKVKFTKAGNQGHIGYSWKKSNGKEGYEEYHPKRFKNHDEVKANIASEIKSQSKKHKGPIERPRGREYVEQVDEAYTVAQRIKAKQRMKKMSKRIQMAKKRAMKRAPSTDKLKLRARKQAKGALVSKWMRGKQKGDLSFSQRQNIEKRLKGASGRIDTMSKKLLPDVRKQDRERRANANKNSEEK